MNSTQAVIIILLVFNLATTMWFGFNKNSQLDIKSADASSVNELPKFINDDAINGLYSDFEKAFNAKNYDALYDMFGDVVKSQVTKSDAKKTLEKLSELHKSVADGAYTHSEFSGEKGSLKAYDLYYFVNYPESGSWAESGTLAITIATQGEKFQIYSIRLDAF